jgi:hypothetical protein
MDVCYLALTLLSSTKHVLKRTEVAGICTHGQMDRFGSKSAIRRYQPAAM